MKRVAWIVLGGAYAALSACSGGTDCVADATLCSDDKVCDVNSRLCVVNVAPVISITAPESGATITTASVEIIGTVVDDERRVERAEYSVDGETWNAFEVADDGAFTFELDVHDRDNVAHALQIRAADRLGQEVSAELSFVVDNVPPACSLISPLAEVIGGTSVSVRYQATDGSEIVTARISTDDGANYHDATLAQGEARYEWTLPQGVLATAGLRVELTDKSGNRCEQRNEIALDTKAPETTIITPAQTQPILVGGPNQQQLEIRLTATDDSGIGSVTFDFDDGNQPHALAFDEPSGEWVLELALPEEDHVAHASKVVVRDIAGNQRELPLALIVDRVPPNVLSRSPSGTGVYNKATLGQSTSIEFSWMVEEGDPAFVRRIRYRSEDPWLTQSADTVGITVGSADNGKQYDLEVWLRDTAGNETFFDMHAVVDVVPPTFEFAVSPNELLAPHDLVVDFSEPVDLTQQPFVTLANLPSSATEALSAGDTRYTLAGLEGDTIYSPAVNLGTFADKAGNPNEVTGAVTYRTQPRYPAPGAILVPGYVNRFETAFDEDGVMSFIVYTLGPSSLQEGFDLYTINPNSGAVEHKKNWSYTGNVYTAGMTVVARRGLSGMSSQRTWGGTMTISYQSGAGFADAVEGQWFQDQNPGQPAAGALIPLPKGCADPFGAGPVAFATQISPYLLKRTGMADESMPVAATSAEFRSSDDWVAFGVSGGTLELARRRCTCITLQPSCSFTAPVQLTASLSPLSNVSTAVVGRRYFAAYSESGTRREACYEVPVDGCVINCSSTLSQRNAEPGLRIAPGTGSNLLGARKVSVNPIELIQRDTSSGCFTNWSVVAQVPNSAGASDWQPVRVGTRSGVVYLENGVLKLWYPPVP